MWASATPAELKQLTDPLGSAAFVVEVADDRFKLLSLNKKHERATGLSHAAISGHFLEDLFPEDMVRHLSANYRLCVERREPIEYDERLYLPGGPRHWHTTLSPILAPTGEVVRLVGTGIDVTAERLASRQLSAKEQRYRAFVEPNPAAIYTIDPDGYFTSCNEATGKLTGIPSEALVDRHYLSLIPVEYRETVEAHFKAALEGQPQHEILQLIRQDGSVINADVSVAPYKVDGKVIGVAGMTLDITDRIQAREALASSERQLRTIINSLPVGIAYVDHKLRLRFFNNRYQEWTGSRITLTEGARVDDILKTRFEQFRAPIEQALSGNEVRFEREEKVGETSYVVEAHYMPDQTADGAVHGFFVMVQDITERKLQEQALTAQAQYDGLTGLLNRRGLMAALDTAMRDCAITQTGLAILFLDLDGFKQVNDTYGHRAGDQLLQTLAERMSSCVRKSDILARISGDEFVILLHGAEEAEEVAGIAKKLLDATSAPVRIQGVDVSVTTSIGAATYQGDNMTSQELLHQADQAMYQAKRQGKNRFMLSPALA